MTMAKHSDANTTPSAPSTPRWIPKLAGLAVFPALLALSWTYLSATRSSYPTLTSWASDVQHYLHWTPAPLNATVDDIPYECDAFHRYTTQIISLDPLVIYIHDFLADADIASLLTTATPKFKPSVVTKGGRTAPDPQRSSTTAFLPADDPAVACVLARARSFAGTLLEGREADEMGRPQLVRYREGQKFNLHYDWYNLPQRLTVEDGSYRFWNRVGSFFAVLEDGCEDGETWFPNVTAVTGPVAPKAVPPSDEQGQIRPLWREHEKGGLAFRPVKGNALFWMNLDANGEGDKRVRHAGLPLSSGQKTAMNIWPRRYFYK